MVVRRSSAEAHSIPAGSESRYRESAGCSFSRQGPGEPERRHRSLVCGNGRPSREGHLQSGVGSARLARLCRRSAVWRPSVNRFEGFGWECVESLAATRGVAVAATQFADMTSLGPEPSTTWIRTRWAAFGLFLALLAAHGLGNAEDVVSLHPLARTGADAPLG